MLKTYFGENVNYTGSQFFTVKATAVNKCVLMETFHQLACYKLKQSTISDFFSENDINASPHIICNMAFRKTRHMVVCLIPLQHQVIDIVFCNHKKVKMRN